MTETDLQLLASFREGVPDPDEGIAERVYARATTAQTRRFHLDRMRRMPSRRRLTLAIALATLVIVPSAVALGSRIVDLFEGTSPTSAVTASYAPLAEAPDAATRQGIADKFPQVDLSKIHGVSQIQTADGPEDLWTAPNGVGGQCIFVDFAGDAPVQGVQPGNGRCDTETPPATGMSVSSFWMLSHRALSTVYGRVYVDASTVKLEIADGSEQTVPVVEGSFLASIVGTGPSAAVVGAEAYDTRGDQAATWTPPK